ncbi:MAG: DUF805 domain-containing protein [Pseudomonadota bacterium]
MTLSRAIISCLRKAFVFHGRASRSEFFYFFPIGVAIPLIGAGAMITLEISPIWWLVVAGVLAFPLFAVGARRLQDTGEQGHDAILPWGFFALAILLWELTSFFSAVLDRGFQTPNPANGPSGLLFVMIYLPATIASAIGVVVCVVRFLSNIAPAFGQCLVASEPGPNKYGPNPTEVPQ